MSLHVNGHLLHKESPRMRVGDALSCGYKEKHWRCRLTLCLFSQILALSSPRLYDLPHQGFLAQLTAPGMSPTVQRQTVLSAEIFEKLGYFQPAKVLCHTDVSEPFGVNEASIALFSTFT